MQTITLSKELIGKSIELSSYSIVSPTGRVSTSAKTKGNPLNCTVYFTGESGKDGQHLKGATLYVSNEQDAAALKAEHDGVETVNINSDTSYRWLKSSLLPADVKAINTLKGVLKVNRILSGGIGSLQQVLKGAAGMYIKGPPQEYRKAFTDKMAGLMIDTCDDIMRVKAEDDAPESFFSVDA